MIKRTLSLALMAMAVAAVAQASPVTLSFNGTVDLSLSGGPVSTPFNGSVTWDPATATLLAGSPATTATYSVTGATLTFNNVNSTANIITTGSPQALVKVFNGGVDSFGFTFNFAPNLPFDISTLIGVFTGPNTIFTTGALPTDLSFMSSMTTNTSIFVCDSLSSTCVTQAGTLNAVLPATPEVPEPATLSLTALGLGATLLKRRRNRRR